MWNRLTEDYWLKSVEEVNLPIFYQSDYLKSVSLPFDLELHYFSYTKNNHIYSLVAFLSNKSKSIVLPEGFSYTAFYIQTNISEKLYVNILTSLIKTLKKDFKTIKLKLPNQITDIRPFTWENFSVEVRYTHLKQNNLPFETSVLKSLGKGFNDEYQFRLEEVNSSNLKINLEFLKTLNFTSKKISQHQDVLKIWAENGYLKAFSLYRSNSLICSNLVLIDIKQLKVYTILLNKVENKFKHAHTFLYANIISWCDENNIKCIDFCGANFKSISEFKSRFNTDLEMYFIVNYNPLKSKLNSAYHSFISKMKRF